MDKKRLFNIYYLNLSKVYEIAMILNNKIIKTLTSEVLTGKEKTKQRSPKVSVDYMNTIKSEINEINSSKTFSSDKIIETLEVKTTKSILLRDILDNCKIVDMKTNPVVGDLLYIDKVNLKLENETELRGFKMLRNDAIRGFNYEGIDISNLINSMLNDYAYTITGKSDNLAEDILMKIPMVYGNEFENLYTINDLLIGNVALVGIYRGKAKKSDLKNNVQVFNEINENNKPEENKPSFKYNLSDSETVIESQEDEIDNIKNKKYDFIDIIAIVQNVNAKEIESIEKMKSSLFKKIIEKVFRKKLNVKSKDIQI